MVPTLAELTARARRLARHGRVIIGIAGAPGAGKSTLAADLSRRLAAPVVAMDGFHLRTAELVALGRLERKGAPDTFDVAGYAGLLTRLRGGGDVRAPSFDRSLEEPVQDAVPVPGDAPIVLTEGNYLLLAEGRWSQVRALLDECWFVEVPEDVRLTRLIARHVEFGRSLAEARRRAVAGSDADNAHLIAGTRTRADLIIRT